MNASLAAVRIPRTTATAARTSTVPLPLIVDTRETCADDAGCDDDDACTDDTCTSTTLLCDHSPTECQSPKKSLCCAGVGCASAARTRSATTRDPCTKDSCSDNKCGEHTVLRQRAECCARADGSSATCGTTAVPPQIATITWIAPRIRALKARAATPTINPVRPGKSAPRRAASKPRSASKTETASPPMPVRRTVLAVNGSCAFSPCAKGTKCCAGEGCKACCADTDCDDRLGCTKDTCNGGVCSNQTDNGLVPGGNPDLRSKVGLHRLQYCSRLQRQPRLHDRSMHRQQVREEQAVQREVLLHGLGLSGEASPRSPCRLHEVYLQRVRRRWHVRHEDDHLHPGRLL